LRTPLKSVFPPVPLGAAEVLTDPARTWQRLLDDIAGARREVLLENYIVLEGLASDALLEALSRAKSAGARILVHADGAGSFLMSARLRRRLEELGELRIYHPIQWSALFRGLRERLLRRTHRRILAVDGKIGWTGGLAIEDPWWPVDGHEQVRETMIRVAGAPAAQLREAFLQLWEERMPGPVHVRVPRDGEALVAPHYALRTHRPARYLRRLIGEARHRVWLGTAYFVPPRPVRRLLYRTAERGVEVRLLLPGLTGHDHPIARAAAHRYYGRLLAKGIRVYEYQPSFYHAKCGLIDDRDVMVGTWNLDRWSFLSNHEIAVFARDPRCALTLEQQFEADFGRSIEFTRESWQARPLRDRLAERFSGLFARWL
jgi:phosphatidylserine/phosphatidylglycerophosphate/cardiolipin synthase-like enzyme